MRLVIQRVTRASVRIDGKLQAQRALSRAAIQKRNFPQRRCGRDPFCACSSKAEIGGGLLVLVGIAATDLSAQADYLADKLVNLRLFPDREGRMNRSALDVGASLLLVSQFTLYGDCRKGRRPSFDAAAPAELARDLYDYLVMKVREKGLVTETGVFQAHMEVELVNDGPVTLLLES